VSEPASPHPLAARYDALWDAAAPEVRAGRVSLDAWALDKGRDARRGVTLLARPSPPVAERLAALLDALRTLEPEQYYQPHGDLHLTVLSLFTATVDHAPYLAHVDDYDAAVRKAVAGETSFTIDVRGMTLSPAAVLAQGFPRDGTVARIRGRLRAALAARGLGGALDGRYRLETAHLTLVRFAAPLRAPARFVDALAAMRTEAFGTTTVAELELVLGDWYQSSERARPIATYPLGAGAAGANT
jgi:2'-5' RNA ligase